MRSIRAGLVLALASTCFTRCGCNTSSIVGDDDASEDSPWDPPIENLGDIGWEEGTVPWCDELVASPIGYDVWSDSRGVFVLMSEFIGGGSDANYIRIYANRGTGWEVELEAHPDPMGDPPFEVFYLSGVPGGPLLAYGDWSPLAVIQDGVLAREDFVALDVFVVNSTLAYATIQGAPRLAWWDGSTWEPYPGDPVPYDVRLVWAGDGSIFCAGDNGTMLINDGSGWIVQETGTMSYFAALWASSSTDVWASTGDGHLLRYDGTSWNDIEYPKMGDGSDACHDPVHAIYGIWGAGETVFFNTSRQFFVWDGAGFSVLGYWPGEYELREGGYDCHGSLGIRGIWGNSPSEVFLAVMQEELGTSGCGSEFLLWWDGHEFHWM